jgi:hypothetical protein
MITQYHFGKNMVSNKLEILFGTNKSMHKKLAN